MKTWLLKKEEKIFTVKYVMLEHVQYWHTTLHSQVNPSPAKGRVRLAGATSFQQISLEERFIEAEIHLEKRAP